MPGKRLFVATLACVFWGFVLLCPCAFAVEIPTSDKEAIDYYLQYLFDEDVDGFTLVCPHCGYEVTYNDAFYTLMCPECGEGMTLRGDDDTLTFHAGGGSFNSGSGAGRQPNGYSGEGIPTCSSDGFLRLTLYPSAWAMNYYIGSMKIRELPDTYLDQYLIDDAGASIVREKWLGTNGVSPVYYFTVPTSGMYFFKKGTVTYFATGEYFQNNEWHSQVSSYDATASETLYAKSYTLTEGEECAFIGQAIFTDNEYPFRALAIPFDIYVDPYTSYFTTVNNFNFNGTLINVAPEGHIYFDSSTNLYFNYDAGENCTIYSPENNYTITYDNTTNNYIITIYNVEKPTPTPDPGDPGTGGESVDLGFISDFFDWWKEQWSDFRAWLAEVLGQPDSDHQHEYNESIVSQPTCVTTGLKIYTCSCGDSYQERTPTIPHDWQLLQEIPAEYDDEGNLVSDGYKLYMCSMCGRAYRDYADTGPPADSEDTEKASIFGAWQILLNLLGFVWNGFSDFVTDGVGNFIGHYTDPDSDIFALIGDVDWST